MKDNNLSLVCKDCKEYKKLLEAFKFLNTLFEFEIIEIEGDKYLAFWSDDLCFKKILIDAKEYELLKEFINENNQQ